MPIYALFVCAVLHGHVQADRCMPATGDFGPYATFAACEGALIRHAEVFGGVPPAWIAKEPIALWHTRGGGVFDTTVLCAENDGAGWGLLQVPQSAR